MTTHTASIFILSQDSHARHAMSKSKQIMPTNRPRRKLQTRRQTIRAAGITCRTVAIPLGVISRSQSQTDLGPFQMRNRQRNFFQTTFSMPRKIPNTYAVYIIQIIKATQR